MKQVLHVKKAKVMIPGKQTSAVVKIQTPASLAALPMAMDTAPIPPSTYLQKCLLSGTSCVRQSL